MLSLSGAHGAACPFPSLGGGAQRVLLEAPLPPRGLGSEAPAGLCGHEDDGEVASRGALRAGGWVDVPPSWVLGWSAECGCERWAGRCPSPGTEGGRPPAVLALVPPDPFAAPQGGAWCLWPGHWAGTASALPSLPILTVLRRDLCREMFKPTRPATGHLRPAGRLLTDKQRAGSAARPGVQCSSQPLASSPPRKPAGQTAPGLHPGKRSPPERSRGLLCLHTCGSGGGTGPGGPGSGLRL